MESDESTRKKKKSENEGADVNDVEIPEIPITAIAQSSNSDTVKKAPSRRFKGNTPTKPPAKDPPALHTPSHNDPKDDEQMLARLKQSPTQQDSQLSLKKSIRPNLNRSIKKSIPTDGKRPTRTKRLPSTTSTELSGVTDTELEHARHEALQGLEVIASRRRQANNGQRAPRTGDATCVQGSGIAPKGVIKTGEHGRIGIIAFTISARISADDMRDNEINIHRCDDPDTIKRTDRYLDFKLALELRNVTGFDDPCAPRNLALTWLADADNFESSSISNADLYQRYAMALFYVSTNMSSTIVAVHAGKVENPWLTEDRVCLWSGITCSNSPEDDTVTGIKLSDLRLSGTIPNELAILVPHLRSMDEIEWTTYNIEKLNLANNEFSGPIPGSIGSLTNLVTLSLESNKISGTLSQLLGNLHNLGMCDCGFYATHYLTGACAGKKSYKWDGTKYNFKIVELDIPGEIGNMELMEKLIVNGNLFSGSIPSEIGMLTNLLMIKMSSNGLEGSIPSEIGQLTRLEQLFLQSNYLTQDIPTEFGMLSNLEHLVVLSNLISTQVPAEVCKLREENLISFTIDCRPGSAVNGVKALCDCCSWCQWNNNG
eukprot:scaffold43228_cov71-Attheya_sp.AAC.4